MMQWEGNEICQRVSQEREYVQSVRRWMHQHPELSDQETEISQKVCQEAERLGLPWERAGETGLVVTLSGARPGKTLVLRCDLDALPVEEADENLKGPKVCVSQNPGVSHACGHDAHTAMMLGAMRVLSGMRDQLEGTILFAFEQGEETSKGVHAMMEVLEGKQVDGCWAIHVYAGLESGKISVDPGPRMAGSNGLRLTFEGKGGHGSRPDQAINPILAVNQCINHLTTAWASRLDVTKTVTLAFGKIFGGTMHNIIPQEAGVEGTVRYFDEAEGEKASLLVKEAAQAAALATGCKLTRLIHGKGMGACVNDPQMAQLAARALEPVLGRQAITDCPPWFASESFSCYLSRWPGVLAFLGIANPEKGTGALHHNPQFDLDEDVLEMGCQATVAYALAFLGE